ncbi:MAG TPA: hypothetical protein PKD54_10445 [Pirellulaceae bacterium]|nr:hypothetical protein [Pirellulaceae bacterium]
MADRPKRRVRPRFGDIIELPLEPGYAYAHYTHKHKTYGHLIRILPGTFRRRAGLTKLQELPQTKEVTVHAIDGQAWFLCVPQVVLLQIENLQAVRIDSSNQTSFVERLAPRIPRFVNGYIQTMRKQ